MDRRTIEKHLVDRTQYEPLHRADTPLRQGVEAANTLERVAEEVEPLRG